MNFFSGKSTPCRRRTIQSSGPDAVAPARKPPARWQADLALGFIAFIWGSTFVLVKGALDDVSTILFLAIRFSVATVALGFVYLRRHGGKITSQTTGRERHRRYAWKGGIVTGLLLYTGYVLQTVGLRFTTPAKSGFVTGLYIVLVPFFAAVVYRTSPQISEVIGALAAMAGLGLMTLNGTSLRMGMGDLLTVGCAIAFAFHILALGHYSKQMDYSWLALVQIGTCATIGLVTFPVVERPYFHPNFRLWAAIGVTSVFATAVAFLLQTWAQQYTTNTRTALIFALEPVFAWVVSYLMASEVLTLRSAAGALCILAGIIIVELKPIGSQRHPSS